jgi:5-methylcytosine-specific restriction endonuclease McrA
MAIKKPKKPTPAKLKKKLWELCRQITDKNYPPICYTCGSQISGSNKQLGHFIPSSVCGAYLRYDLRNLRWQCMRCNISAGGNGAEYYRRMVKEKGKKHVEELFRDKQKIIKADVIWLQNKIDEYTKSLSTFTH